MELISLYESLSFSLTYLLTASAQLSQSTDDGKYQSQLF
jgi:hypothetical protein